MRALVRHIQKIAIYSFLGLNLRQISGCIRAFIGIGSRILQIFFAFGLKAALLYRLNRKIKTISPFNLILLSFKQGLLFVPKSLPIWIISCLKVWNLKPILSTFVDFLLTKCLFVFWPWQINVAKRIFCRARLPVCPALYSNLWMKSCLQPA